MVCVRTAQNLHIHELIGLHVVVKASLSLPHQGIRGIVVDETKNTLVLRTRDGQEKVVPKKGCVFRFRLPDGTTADLLGDKIAVRPYDRPKKLKNAAKIR